MLALLAAAALAGRVDEVPKDAPTVRVLLCAEVEICTDDAEWLEGLEGPEGPPFVVSDIVLDVDQAVVVDGASPYLRFEAALRRAREAVAAKEWRGVELALDDADAALVDWPGAVPNQDLFELSYLRGAARLLRGARSTATGPLRQAASVGWRREVTLPELPPEVELAWLEETRKLVLAGPGLLHLQQGWGEATTYAVDGVIVPAGQDTLEVLAGTHRITAVDSSKVRTWRADVPGLPGRTVAVWARYDTRDDVLWLRERLTEAFDTLVAPREVTDLLADWAARNDAARLALLEVDWVDRPKERRPVWISDPHPYRPAAAAGEPVPEEDGLPIPFEDAALAAHEERQAGRPPEPIRRLRVLFFDPLTRRFSTEERAPPALADVRRPKVRVGVALGYQGMLGHSHVTADLTAAHPIGPLMFEARLGLVRAESDYWLYPTWTDRQLYHGLLGASWALPRDVSPYALVGAEVYAPVALGGRVEAGLQATADGWIGRAGGSLSVLDQGLGGGVAVGFGRAF